MLKFLEKSTYTSLKQSHINDNLFVPSRLKFLKEYAAHDASIPMIFEDDSTQFALEKLSLQRSYVPNDEMLLQIVNRCKNSLTQVEIDCCFGYQQTGLAILNSFAINNLPKMKLLKVIIPSNYQSDDNDEQEEEEAEEESGLGDMFKPNQTLKTLIINGNDGNLIRIHALIGNAPNVDNLVLNMSDEISNQLMTFVSNNLSKLRVLRVRRLLDTTFNNLNFPEIRELNIEQFDLSLVGLRSVIDSCPKLEKLTIEWIRNPFLLSDAAVGMIAVNLKCLKHLYFGQGFLASRQIFADLMENCKELKTVTIVKDAIVDDKAIIDEITKSNIQLVVLDKPNFKLRTDFDLWSHEDVDDVPAEYDLHEPIDPDADFPNETDDDIDFDGAGGDWYGDDDFDEFNEEDEDDDDFFGGGIRPG
jgi:hypothetical protein